MPSPKAVPPTYQLKITLTAIKPSIWRRRSLVRSSPLIVLFCVRVYFLSPCKTEGTEECCAQSDYRNYSF